ncbi:hypothetical protein [Corynebacterium cystitidis]|uniref:hypothetical protein n=1 Tax=Corynebacterium cystitidis TaxID=35757 RepID=UPI00211EC9EE|nr:hypothetical protein [Corynebacterium cystitidis]
MTTFNEMFVQARGKPITIGGMTLDSSLEVAPLPHEMSTLSWEFESPWPKGQVGLKLRAIDCSFQYADVDTHDLYVLHGQANQGSVTIANTSDISLVGITNIYRSGTTLESFEYCSGDQAMRIDETSPGVFAFRANNGSPADRMALADISGTITITPAPNNPSPQSTDMPSIQRYCYIDTTHHSTEDEALIGYATTVTGNTAATIEAIKTLIGRFDGSDHAVVASAEDAVVIEVDISDEETTEFSMVDEAHLWGLSIVRLFDRKVLTKNLYN